MIKLTPFQWAAFNFFGFFCAYGVFMPFMPVWLKAQGYETEMIGLLASVGYLFRFLGGILASKRVKKTSQLIPTARLLTLLNFVAVLLLAYAADQIWLLFPALMLFHIFNAGSMPIADSIASIWQQQQGLDYGKARLFGSAAFVVGSISAGYFVGWWGSEAVLWGMGGYLLFLSLGQHLSPTIFFQEKAADQAKNATYGEILKEKNTLRMLGAISLITASHAMYYTYSTIHWTQSGLDTQTISLLWGLAVVAEIIFFLFSKRLFKNWQIRHLMWLSAIAAVIRWSVFSATSTLWLLIIFQTFHAFTFGAGHYAMIRYIASQPTENVTKLQGLYFGLASCAMMAIMTFLSGVLYQQSATLAFSVMAVCAFLAVIIAPKVFDAKLNKPKCA